MFMGFWHAQIAPETNPPHQQWDFDALASALSGSSRASFLTKLENKLEQKHGEITAKYQHPMPDKRWEHLARIIRGTALAHFSKGAQKQPCQSEWTKQSGA